MKIGLPLQMGVPRGRRVKGNKVTTRDAPQTSIHLQGGGEKLTATSHASIAIDHDDPVTLFLWVKMSLGTNPFLISKYNQAGSGKGWAWYVNSNKMRWLLNRSGAEYLIVDSTSTHTDGEWCLLSMSTTGLGAAGVKHFLNGVTAGEATVLDNAFTATITSAVNMHIGARNDGAAAITGNVGTCAMYNRSFSAAEHLAVYNAGKDFDHANGAYAADLISSWNPDDLSGTTIADESPVNSNDLSMTGGAVNANQALDSPFYWTPSSFTTGCDIWYRADLGVTLNGSDVSDWADQTGKENHATQGTVAHQPVYLSGSANMNGHPALKCSSGTYEHMAVNYDSGVAIDLTVFMVIKSTVSSSGDNNYFIDFQGADRFLVALERNALKQTHYYTTADGFEVNAVAVDGTYVYTCRCELGVGGQIWRNSTSLGTGTFASKVRLAGADGAPDTSRLPGPDPVELLPADWELAEFILYREALSTANRQAVETYLTTRYGL